MSRPYAVNYYFDLVRAWNTRIDQVVAPVTEDHFVAAVESALESAIRHIEGGAKHYQDHPEPALSYTLTILLAAMGFQAAPEHYHKGHVDLVILSEYQPAWHCLGECKIYNYYAYHLKGLKQLLDYCCGAERKVFLIEFFNKAGMYSHLEALKKDMDAQKPHGQVEEGKPHPMKGGFETRHPHVSDATITVAHLGCNVAV